jgi:hypothetical protein
MEKPLSLFIGGLVSVTTGHAVARLDDLYVRSGTAVPYQSILRWSRQS